MFFPDCFLFISNLFVAGSTLQKKWKNIRDSFAKELRKQKTLKSGSGAQKSNPYIYFQRLLFLEPTVSNKTNTTSSMDSQLEDEIEAIAEDEDLLSAPSEPIRGAVERMVTGSNKKLKMNPVDKHYIDILTKSVALREQREEEKFKEDDDKLFCMSLYKEFKKIPEHGRIRTKIQLLEVIQRAQDFYGPPQSTQSYTSYPSNSYNRFADYGANQQRSQHPPIPQDGFGNFRYNGQSAASADPQHLQPLLPRATTSTSDSITSSQQRSQSLLIPQDGYSGHSSYNSQAQASADASLSQSLLARSAISPTDSLISQVSSELSDIYN